KMYDFGL
uniref:Cydiastatin-7 n=1 Tax=Cydia pomonella TaxID=82600 RepID=ALL7_CYDPO|nr:RecName: Full=Cydiastatin-7 [Cydia pomonella]